MNLAGNMSKYAGYMVAALKVELRKRNAKVTGKMKDLVER